MSLAPSGSRPGMLLNASQGTGQPPRQRIIQTQMSREPKLRNPALREGPKRAKTKTLMLWKCLDSLLLCVLLKRQDIFLFFFFHFIYLILFFNFTILYWFCHISKWIRHRYTCVSHPEPSSLLPPHTILLGRPSAPAPSMQYLASNLDWRLVSYMIFYMFQCHSPKSSHPLPLPQSPEDCSIHQCLFCCLVYRVIITIFLNSIYMR